MNSPVERLETINQRLLDLYGRIENGMVRWRVVWSTDQTEKRWVDIIGNIQLLHPEVREMPKYPLSQDFYVLERVVPTAGNPELIEPWSYEPMWTFMTSDRTPLPPKWEAIVQIIHQIHENMMNAGKRPPVKSDESPEAAEARYQRIYNALYGNETNVNDALARGEGVGFTTSKILH